MNLRQVHKKKTPTLTNKVDQTENLTSHRSQMRLLDLIAPLSTHQISIRSVRYLSPDGRSGVRDRRSHSPVHTEAN